MTKSAWLGGLLFAPALAIASAYGLRNVRFGEASGAAFVFALGALSGFVALAIAARAALSTRGALVLAASAVLVEVVAALGTQGLLRAIMVDGALVAFAHAAGASIGRRVAHPGHLLPACVVAACADVASVLSPSGPSHAIASSERALSLLAISFPVPGESAVAPVLGLGDLLFFALLLGATAAHGLSLGRATILGVAGVAIAGVVAAFFEAPCPALLPIGACFVAGMPQARTVLVKDRAVTWFAIMVSGAVAIGVVLLRLVAKA